MLVYSWASLSAVSSSFFLLDGTDCHLKKPVLQSDLVSPQLYFDSEAPAYRTGAIGVLTFSIVALLTALCMYAWFRHQNAMRDKLALTNPEADPSVPPSGDEDQDRTDLQDLRFRYMM
jgi:ACS family allantoate permease-like MFS transporter